MKLIQLILLASFFGFLSIQGQENESIKNSENFKRHSIGIMTGYAWVPQSVSSSDSKDVIVIPTIGIDYAFAFSPKFSLALVNDFEFSSYFVEDNEGTTIERENKYIIALTALYHVNHWIGIYAGPGIEYDKHQSYAVFKVGGEIYKHFEDNWGVGFNVSVDFNETYETFSGGVVVARMF